MTQGSMSKDERVANVVLGGGEAGKHIAWELARQGKPVVVIERGLIGGSCPNIACLPSKNVIRSAQVANFVRHGVEYGVPTPAVVVDMAGVRARKRAMVDAEIAAHRARFASPGVTFLLAEGRVVGPRTVEARLAGGDTRRLLAEHVFLDLGTRASMPDIPGLAEAAPLTHVEALELGRLPEHLIVIGVGYVGAELAQATAQRRGIAVRVARLPMTQVLRARAVGDLRGYMKVLVEAAGDQILGFTMLGAEAGEVVSVIQTAMLAGLPCTALRDAILAHPTMAEGLGALLADVPG
jgi:pyruvate/2-oxoglutarate dehydrogenase complex dihydrolipoamide dehydrogenase (E3) component